MSKSEELFERAKALMPGGVNSPVRAFGSVGGTPPFIASGSGARMTDVDGNTYIDYVGSWGPLVLGHVHPRVLEVITAAAQNGFSFGACHVGEIDLAERIHHHMPHVEKLRLVNSGTEAVMSALRLARAATGRDAIIKFAGCYHGHVDACLIAAGSGALTFGTPSSPGVTAGAAQDTLLATYNDLASVAALFQEHADKIACLIVEPVAGNMGVVLPADGFLRGLRDLCDKHGALLIFDEVITGFRIGIGGAAARFNVTPDLTILGKIIGGGMPVGAYGGRADLMNQISPDGGVYQAGTLSGNPLATAAGVATIDLLAEENPYPHMETLAIRLGAGVVENLNECGMNMATVNRIAGMSTLFFGIAQATSFAEVMQADTEMFGRYHRAMLAGGVYLAPSQFEAGFVSAAHTEADIDATLEIQRAALKSL